MNKFLKKIVDSATNVGIPTILIGGLALPAYKVARSTLDIDLCIHAESQKKLDKFIDILEKQEIYTKQKPKTTHDLFLIFERKNEAEIWLRPCDAFDWDEEMLNRTHSFQENLLVLAVEDFIMTKLGRADRSSIDINDILQILIANIDTIDWKYLRYRLDWLRLTDDFTDIIKAFSLNIDSQYLDKAKLIEDKFEKSTNI